MLKKEEEIEKEVRRWLEHVVANGAYNYGVLLALKNLYYQGASDVKNEIKDILDIEDCDCL